MTGQEKVGELERIDPFRGPGGGSAFPESLSNEELGGAVLGGVGGDDSARVETGRGLAWLEPGESGEVQAKQPGQIAAQG